MKVLMCFGTRPEAIKMAPLYHELKKSTFEVKVCVTAQHRQMLDQVLNFFEIVPEYDLNLMKHNQSLNDLSSRILKNIDCVLEKELPDLVLVHGDTTSSSMVALGAFHRKIKIAHIEAGLRTYNSSSPFPEEINRQITARLANYHFAPTLKAYEHLQNESLSQKNILVTGNTIVDALLWAEKKMNNGNYKNLTIEKLKNKIKKDFILVTLHRRENFGDGLVKVLNALNLISKTRDIQIVFPVHFNPSVRKQVEENLQNSDKIILIDPVEYPVMVWLLKSCKLVLTDSGGIQEEAPTFNKPIIVAREISERPEGVESGFSFIAGTDTNKILNLMNELLDNDFINAKTNPYGVGAASELIVDYLSENLL